MANLIKLDLDQTNSESFLKILENLETTNNSIWDGRIVTDQIALKNYSYENLLKVFQKIQEQNNEDSEQLDLMRAKLLQLNITPEDKSYLSLDNAKNLFHSLINYAKGESIDPEEILLGPVIDDEEIELDEEIKFDEDTKSSFISEKFLTPKWTFVAGVVGGIALSVLFFSTLAYLNQTEIPCTPPIGLNDENSATFCRIAKTSTDKKALPIVEKILKDLQNSNEKIAQLQKDVKICSDTHVGYNIPEIHAKIHEWLADPARSDSALELLVEMSKHDASDLRSINLVKKGIYEFVLSDNSALQLKALKALFAIYPREGLFRDVSLKFENIFENPTKIHKENFESLKMLIKNSNLDKNDFKYFFSAFNHIPKAQFSKEHEDFSKFLLNEHFINKMDISGSLQAVDALISHSRNDRAYAILNEITNANLNHAQSDLARAAIQKLLDNSPLMTPDLNQLLPVVKTISNNAALTIPSTTIQKIVKDGTLENCNKLSELLASTGNSNQLNELAKMLLTKKTYSYWYGLYTSELDKQKQQMGLDINFQLENPPSKWF